MNNKNRFDIGKQSKLESTNELAKAKMSKKHNQVVRLTNS